MTEAEFSAKLDALAAEARPTSDDDWGTERQTNAQNAFFDFLKEHMHPMAFEELEMWCLSATTDEMIDKGLQMMREE